MASDVLSPYDLRNEIPLRPGARMSDQELMRFSEEYEAHRFERMKDGEIVMMSPLGGLAGIGEGWVFYSLMTWNETSGTGVAFPANIGFNLRDGSCLAPDAAWISLSRWKALTPREQAGFPPLCPDFLIEVRSQSDSRPVLELKMQQWIENGAQLAWLIDPVEASVSVYRPNEPTETLERPDIVIAHAPVSGFEFRTTRLWPAH